MKAVAHFYSRTSRRRKKAKKSSIFTTDGEKPSTLELFSLFFFFKPHPLFFSTPTTTTTTTQKNPKQLPQRHPPGRLRLRPARPLRPRGSRSLRQPQVAGLLRGHPRQVGHARRGRLHRAGDPRVGRRDPAVALRGPVVQVRGDPARRHLRARLLGGPLLALLARGRRDAVCRAQEMAGLPPPGLAGQAVLPRHGERLQRLGRPGVPRWPLVQHVQPGQDRGRHEGVEDQGGESFFFSVFECFFGVFFSFLFFAFLQTKELLFLSFSNQKNNTFFPLSTHNNSSRTAGSRCSPSSATAPRRS